MNKVIVKKSVIVVAFIIILIGLILSFMENETAENKLWKDIKDFYGEDVYWKSKFENADSQEGIFGGQMKVVSEFIKQNPWFKIAAFCSLGILLIKFCEIKDVNQKNEEKIINQKTLTTVCWNCNYEFAYTPNPYGVKQVTCPNCGQIGIIPKEN